MSAISSPNGNESSQRDTIPYASVPDVPTIGCLCRILTDYEPRLDWAVFTVLRKDIERLVGE